MVRDILLQRGSFCKTIVVLLLLAMSSVHMSAQVIKDFKPRKSSKASAPHTNKSNYYLKGDFTMIGNVNLETVQSNQDNNNSKAMKFIDIDGDSNTKNSSSAKLVIPDPECSEIVYAGLYWSGRAEQAGIGSDTFNGLDKREVKFKAGTENYTTVTANYVNSQPEILFPKTTNIAADPSNNINAGKTDWIYAAYADVTDYVTQHGAVDYFVADMALKEGNGGGTGYFGGWGMVVIYKNANMTWRDITVFDGYAFANNTVQAANLPVSGFSAAQNGPVKVRMGIMAGEGDRSLKGDYFRMRKADESGYIPLSHPNNTTNDFFNSSIYTLDENDSPTPRNPNKANNMGIDIAMFNLVNTNNYLINNSQTNTMFQYGTDQDAYAIFNIVFAVDAYVPEIVGENSPSSYNGYTPVNGGSVDAGQEFEFKLDVYNKGDEALNNAKVEIPIPSILHYVGSDIIGGLPVPAGNVTWVPPLGAPIGATSANTTGGTLVWEIGVLPLDNDPNKGTLMATLKYRFKVTEDCYLLTTSLNSCLLSLKINGEISGVGAISGISGKSPLVGGYDEGACAGPVYDSFESTVLQSSINCNLPEEDGILQYAFCSQNSNEIDRQTVANNYPDGTKFYSSIPSSYNSDVNLVTAGFPIISNQNTSYYAMIPGMVDGCYLLFNIKIKNCAVITNPMLPSKAKND